MNTPTHPRRERENIAAERADVTIHLEDEEFGPGSLNHHQRAILRQLTRLHRSLRGPQGMLEKAANFTRPFPHPPHNRQPPPPPPPPSPHRRPQ
jgi:hypothetical protein